MLADDPRHGTNAGYYAGCHDDCCRTAATRYVKRLRMDVANGLPRMVPALGTLRRVEALMALGWSQAIIADRIGMRQPNLSWIMRGRPERVRRDTADRIAAVYADLCMSVAPYHHASNRVRNLARSRGYAPPLAWDDIDTDAEPRGNRAGSGAIDPVVVARVLAGEWHLACLPAEKTAIAAEWVARGRVLTHLERLTGWRVARYYKIKDVAA